MPPNAQGSRVLPEEEGLTLSALVRRRLAAAGAAASWSRARELCERGKVILDGKAALDPAARVKSGQRVVIDLHARPPKPPTAAKIVFEDAHLVVIDKPSGVSSVPFAEGETGTAMESVLEAWRHQRRRSSARGLRVVHRIDKETSGLLAFAKSGRAEEALKALFHAHDIERAYLCVACGRVSDRTIESMLVPDRGDGLRGSTRRPGMGKRALTHVRVLERLGEATLCEARLETGRTHQIRIHLSEAGHPILGERVYIRECGKNELELIESPRLLLHAATLGFI
ncbi:MAG: RluA family pseudouridine synthase, partial [Elusimicrobiota bacterium]